MTPSNQSMSDQVQDLLAGLPSGDPLHNPVILIPVFNNARYLRNFLKQLADRQLNRFLVLDGGSSEPRTKELIQDLNDNRRVLHLPDNPGPRHFFDNKAIFDNLPDVFCVSDPDLQLNPDLPSNFIERLHALTTELSVWKAGFALDLSGEIWPDAFFFGGKWRTIREWESQFWQTKVDNSTGLEVYQTQIDTTFALYNKAVYERDQSFFPALRVAGDFTAVHLPWLVNNPFLNNQEDPESPPDGIWTNWTHNSSIRDLNKAYLSAKKKVAAMENSISWKITAPLRAIREWWQRSRQMKRS